MAFSWILFTLMAAFMQAWRNAFQKQLSSTVDVWGVTLARFIFALPFALIYILSLYYFSPVISSVSFSTQYWIYIIVAGASQILATALMVNLFKQKIMPLAWDLLKVKRF